MYRYTDVRVTYEYNLLVKINNVFLNRNNI